MSEEKQQVGERRDRPIIIEEPPTAEALRGIDREENKKPPRNDGTVGGWRDLVKN